MKSGWETQFFNSHCFSRLKLVVMTRTKRKRSTKLLGFSAWWEKMKLLSTSRLGVGISHGFWLNQPKCQIPKL
jgi:hypothetical protein